MPSWLLPVVPQMSAWNPKSGALPHLYPSDIMMYVWHQSTSMMLSWHLNNSKVSVWHL